MFEPISAQIDLILRHRVKHKRVIRIRGVTQGKDFNLLLLHFGFFVICHSIFVIELEELGDEGVRRLNERPQKIAQFQRLAELASSSKNKTAAAISRGGCLKLLYAYLISSLIGSRPLEASA